MTAIETRFRYEGADGAGLAGFVWRDPDAAPRGVLQLAHGAGEHAGRYFGPLAPVHGRRLDHLHGRPPGPRTDLWHDPPGRLRPRRRACGRRRHGHPLPPRPVREPRPAAGADGAFDGRDVRPELHPRSLGPDRRLGALGHGRPRPAHEGRSQQRLRQPAHGLRLAEPRRGRGRPLHRRPLLRHPVHPRKRRQLRGPARTRS
jgi:hypothetical protein